MDIILKGYTYLRVQGKISKGRTWLSISNIIINTAYYNCFRINGIQRESTTCTILNIYVWLQFKHVPINNVQYTYTVRYGHSSNYSYLQTPFNRVHFMNSIFHYSCNLRCKTCRHLYVVCNISASHICLYGEKVIPHCGATLKTIDSTRWIYRRSQQILYHLHIVHKFLSLEVR